MAPAASAKKLQKKSAPSKGKWGETLTVEEQHQVRREVLFRTAAQAFNESGFYNTTLDDIAARLNVSKPTLYYYVKSKDDILLECNRLAFAHMQNALKEAQLSKRSGIDKLTQFLLTYVQVVANEFGRCLIRTGLQPLSAESREQLKPAARHVNKALQDIITSGIKDGSIRKCEPKLVANAIFGSFNSVALWHREDGKFSPADIAENYIELFIKGLKAR